MLLGAAVHKSHISGEAGEVTTKLSFPSLKARHKEVSMLRRMKHMASGLMVTSCHRKT